MVETKDDLFLFCFHIFCYAHYVNRKSTCSFSVQRAPNLLEILMMEMRIFVRTKKGERSLSSIGIPLITTTRNRGQNHCRGDPCPNFKSSLLLPVAVPIPGTTGAKQVRCVVRESSLLVDILPRPSCVSSTTTRIPVRLDLFTGRNIPVEDTMCGQMPLSHGSDSLLGPRIHASTLVLLTPSGRTVLSHVKPLVVFSSLNPG